MSVPETAVNEHCDSTIGEVEVRFADEVRLNYVLEPKPIEKRRQLQLRSGALATNRLHYPSAGRS